MKSKLPSAPYKNDFPFVISCDVPFHPPPPNAPKPNEDELFITANKSNKFNFKESIFFTWQA